MAINILTAKSRVTHLSLKPVGSEPAPQKDLRLRAMLFLKKVGVRSGEGSQGCVYPLDQGSATPPLYTALIFIPLGVTDFGVYNHIEKVREKKVETWALLS